MSHSEIKASYKILSNEHKNKKIFENLILELAAYDYSSYQWKNAGLFDGTAGISIFYYEVYQLTGQTWCLDRCLSYFEKAYNNLKMDNFNLSHGCTGVMWLMNYLIVQKVLPQKYQEYLTRFDKSLYNVIDCYSHNLDPMHGLLSIANYLFSRKKAENTESLIKILKSIDRLKIVSPSGIFWQSSSWDPEIGIRKHINLGYAHGILAILYFLSKYMHNKIEEKLSGQLFREGMKYMLSHYNNGKESVFPHRIHPDKIAVGTRLAYCYGDLGLACGFSAIGKNLNDDGMREIAIHLAKRTSMQVEKENESIRDIGLCHGASGNGYMFYRLYQDLGNPEFLRAANKQFHQLLNLRQEGMGIIGFSAIDFNKDTSQFYRRANPGFIEGVAGVGLALIEYVKSKSQASWDQLLYLS